MDCPEDLRYTKEHEWVRLNDDQNIVTVGVTDYAQGKLGDVVHVEVPEEGDQVRMDQPLGSIESVKAVSDIFSPISGEITEINNVLLDSPEVLNEDPYGDGWIARVKVSNATELESLMSPQAYIEFVQEEEAAA